MRQVFNFSAGPAVLPEEVLAQAAAEMLDWHGSGQSVMEMSHRGKEYMSIHEQAERDLRALMGIPSNYKVLFLQGGATMQFAMVPINLMRGKAGADYVNTGEWSKKAIKGHVDAADRGVVGLGHREREVVAPVGGARGRAEGANIVVRVGAREHEVSAGGLEPGAADDGVPSGPVLRLGSGDDRNFTYV